MAQHGRTVKHSYCETVYVLVLFNYSSRVPIPHWLCILHVHWCRDCETVPEQHWNKPATVSQSQCIPTQCKQTIFGIKNESEVQGQSSSDLTGILTALKWICGPNLEIITWIGDEKWVGQAQNGVNIDKGCISLHDPIRYRNYPIPIQVIEMTHLKRYSKWILTSGIWEKN